MTEGRVNEYVDRTLDLATYHGIQPVGNARLVEALAPDDASGAIVTGVQKVAQRFLVELLKEQGSMPFRPDEGTVFLTEAKEGRFQTQADVLGAFARGVVEARRVIQADESEDDPPDERFVDAEVLEVFVAPGTAVVKFRIVTAAGSDRQFIFPLRIPI